MVQTVHHLYKTGAAELNAQGFAFAYPIFDNFDELSKGTRIFKIRHYLIEIDKNTHDKVDPPADKNSELKLVQDENTIGNGLFTQ